MGEFAASQGSLLSPDGAGRIGFLGTGRLTSMLVHRLVETGYASDRIVVSARNRKVANELSAETNVAVEDDLQAIASAVDCLILCLPLASARAELAALALRPDQVVISMIGGLGFEDLQPLCDPARACCAMLPGLPSRLGAGLTLIHPDLEGVEPLLTQFGALCPADTPEAFDRLSTYGGLSGCLFHQIWTMERALGDIGVDAKAARVLLGNAFKGVGETVLAYESTCLADLTSQVVTPGGITEKGIRNLEAAHLGDAWAAATIDMWLALGGAPSIDHLHQVRRLKRA